MEKIVSQNSGLMHFFTLCLQGEKLTVNSPESRTAPVAHSCEPSWDREFLVHEGGAVDGEGNLIAPFGVMVSE